MKYIILAVIGILSGCATVPEIEEPPPEGYRYIPCSRERFASNFNPLCSTGKMLQRIPEKVVPVQIPVQIPQEVNTPRAPSKALLKELKSLNKILEKK